MKSFAWVLDEGKFLTQVELTKLIKVVNERKHQSKPSFRDYFTINLALETGLRVNEMSLLKIEDLKVRDSNSSLKVVRGKNGKPRLVKFSDRFKQKLIEYLDWKKEIGEPLNPDSPLIYSSISNGHKMTTRGIQKIFERSAERAGVLNHSIHHCRHTYASHLYKASNYNLRLLQILLGHSSIQTTEIYAHVLEPDLDKAVNNLYSDI